MLAIASQRIQLINSSICVLRGEESFSVLIVLFSASFLYMCECVCIWGGKIPKVKSIIITNCCIFHRQFAFARIHHWQANYWFLLWSQNRTLPITACHYAFNLACGIDIGQLIWIVIWAFMPMALLIALVHFYAVVIIN